MNTSKRGFLYLALLILATILILRGLLFQEEKIVVREEISAEPRRAMRPSRFSSHSEFRGVDWNSPL